MGLSAQEIAAVVKELAPAVTGGWIQKVYQPTSRTVMLDIRAPGRTLSLYLSADPETARIHLMTHRYPNPASPPPFCQFLRAHIQGARIERLEQVQDDRIVRLHLMARGGPCALIAELTGRRANLLLIDADEKILAGLDTDRDRVGQIYRPPTLRTERRETNDVELLPLDNSDCTISAAIEARYRRREEELATNRLRQARSAELKKRIKKAARRVDALQTDLDKAARYRDYARYGELVKANLHLMHKGQERLTVVDYFDEGLPELVIPIDPSKSPHGNMEDYFKKHRKHLVAEREVRPRVETEERTLKILKAELAELERGTWHPPPSPSPHSQTGRENAVASPLAHGDRTKVRGQSRSGPFRRLMSADGFPIYVGRNAHENEALTFGEARPDDLWLHAHGTPGSHVVVRLEKGADPPPETLRDAATLALLYSDLKKSGKGEVIYTRKKHVRKVKGRSPGTVTVTQEKTIYITLDRVRLDRLKDRSS